ncbi:MAG: hypothetical protein LAT81_07675, partial [Oceanicaulis sp.]|nr:hypothetical protein [Oceanicaulis sp.]
MTIGDLYDGELRETQYAAMLRNDTLLMADRMVVAGDVQGSKVIGLEGYTLDVRRTSVQFPAGAAASGVMARQLLVSLDEQLDLSGWLRGLDLVDLEVTGSTGSGALVFQGSEPNSITAGAGSEISVANDDAVLNITTSHSIASAAGIFAGFSTEAGVPLGGAGAEINVHSGTGILITQGGMVAARADNASIIVSSEDYLHVNAGASVTAGARFEVVGATPVPIQTGVDTSLVLSTRGEMRLAGAITSGGNMSLVYGETVDDFADYFDTIPGRTLTSIDATEALLEQIRNGEIPQAVLDAIESANLPLDAALAGLTPITSLAPFGDLSAEEQNAIALSLGYLVFPEGGFYNPDAAAHRQFLAEPSVGFSLGYNIGNVAWGSAGAPASGTDFAALSVAQQEALAAHFSYSRFTGDVLIDADNGRVVTSLLEGPQPDYDNRAIDWGLVPPPSMDTDFLDLTRDQKLVVAQALGYGASFQFFNEHPPQGLQRGQTSFEAGQDYSNAEVNWGVAGSPAADAQFDELTLLQQVRVAEHLGYALSGDLEFSNPAGPEGRKLISGEYPPDYYNGDINWSAAGVSAPPIDAEFWQLSSDQQMAVIEALGYEIDEDDPDYAVNEDARPDRQRIYIGPQPDYSNLTLNWDGEPPAEDASFADLTDAQKDRVREVLGRGGDDFVQGEIIPTFTQGEASVTLRQGPPTDYFNADIDWAGAGVAAPGAGVAFVDLTHAQKQVVADYLGHEVVQLGGPAQALADADVDWAEIGVNADLLWSELSSADQQKVADALGFDLRAAVFVNLDTAPALQVVYGFAEGEGAVFDFDRVDWEDVPRPEIVQFSNAAINSTGSAVRTVDLADVNLVVDGVYRLFVGDHEIVYVADADDDLAAVAAGLAELLNELLVDGESAFTAAAEGALLRITAGAQDLSITAEDSRVADLTDEQLALLLEKFGYTYYDTRVFFDPELVADTPERAVRESLVPGADYQLDAPGAGEEQRRWLLSDGDRSYLIYGFDQDGTGISAIQIQQPHELLGQRGYGFLLTGTLTTLQDGEGLSIAGEDDVIIRGNINLLGEGADLELQSDRWIYWEGNANVTGNISLFGGVQQNALGNWTGNGANSEGWSVYVHATSTLNTLREDTHITIHGGQDVILNGRLVAGALIGEEGPEFIGVGDSTVTVVAGEHILLDTAIAAARAVTLQTLGAPSERHDGMAILMTSASGITVPGLTSDGSGGLISVDAQGDVQVISTLTAGGQVRQVFDEDGNLESETVTWLSDPGVIDIRATGQVYIGGLTATQSGGEVEIGGRLRAASLIHLDGGQNSDGIGVKLPGGAQLSTAHEDGVIHIRSADDAELFGMMVAGGQIIDAFDSRGNFLGSTALYGEGASEIRVEADRQIRLTRSLYAGALIDLRGGETSIAEGVPFADQGIVLGGTVNLRTGLEDSVINLSSSGNMILTAPLYTQRLMADGFAEFAAGDVSASVTLRIEVDLGTHVVRGDVVLDAATTLGNNGLGDLVNDLRNAIAGTDFEVVPAASNPPGLGATQRLTADELEVRLEDGRLKLTGGFEIRLLADGSVNADLLGFTQLQQGDAVSYRPVTVDASQSGSVVNFGREGARNGDVTISGWVIGHDAINLFGGIQADGLPNMRLTASGIFETRSGNIELAPNGHAVLEGTLIARGNNASIIIDAAESLELRGDLIANRDITVTAGTAGSTAAVSLETFGTARFISEGDNGRVRFSGENDVVINSQIGRDRAEERNQGIQLVELVSRTGTLTLDRSALIDTNGQVNLSGQDVVLQGVIESVRNTPSLLDYEVRVIATGDLQVSGSHDIAGSVLLRSGGLLEIVNTRLLIDGANQRLTVQAGTDLLVGTTDPQLPAPVAGVSVNGPVADAGAERVVDLTQLEVKSGTQYILRVGDTFARYITSSLDGLDQLAEGLQEALIELGFSAEVEGTGQDPDAETLDPVRVRITSGAGDQSIVLEAVAAGAVVLQADRLLEMTAGDAMVLGGDALLYAKGVDSRINLRAANIQVSGGVRAGAAFDADADDGVVSSWISGGGFVDIRATDALRIGGVSLSDDLELVLSPAVVQATGEVRLRAGIGSDGVGIRVEQAAAVRVDATGDGEFDAASAGRISLDADGGIYLHGIVNAVDTGARLTVASRGLVYVDGLVRASDRVSITAGTHASGAALAVTGVVFDQTTGERISGGTLDTDVGGELVLRSTGDMLLAGVVGQLEDDNVTARSSRIDMVSSAGNILITGLVDARDDVSIVANRITMTLGSHVFALEQESSAYLRARDRMDILGQITDEDAIIKGDMLVHLAAPTIYVDGILKTEAEGSRILVNVSKDLRVAGLIQSAGNVELNAGVNLSAGRDALEGTIDGDALGNGNIRVVRQGVVQAGMIAADVGVERSAQGGDLIIKAGGEVILDADPNVDGERAIIVPVITTIEEEVEVVIGYQEVAVGTIQVPVITYEQSLITEQVGTELVQVGERFYRYDVLLSQIGYYNPNADAGDKFRETFIESIDYSNDDVNWSNAGSEGNPGQQATRPTQDRLVFNALSEAQQQAVLNHLGYMRVFEFTYSVADSSGTVHNNKVALERTLNGQVSRSIVTPDWAADDLVYVPVDVAGWRDKYILMPSGAQENVLRVVSQGDPRYLYNDTTKDGDNNGVWLTLDQASHAHVRGEWVGQYQETAQVRYVQDRSVWDRSGGSSGPNSGISGFFGGRSSVTINDFDNSIGRWQIEYVIGSGNWTFDLADRDASLAEDPFWILEDGSQTYIQVRDTVSGGRATTLVYGPQTFVAADGALYRDTASMGQTSTTEAGVRIVGSVVTSTKKSVFHKTRTSTQLIPELFLNYEYDWASTYDGRNVYDDRIQLSYELTTQASPIWDYRPVFETSVRDVMVVTFEDVTVWRTDPIVETTFVTRTEQGVREIPLLGADYGGESLFATNIDITSGGATRIGGLVKAYEDLTITTGGNLDVNAMVDEKGDLVMSMLAAGDDMTLTAGNSVRIASTAELAATHIVITADRDVVINAQIGTEANGGIDDIHTETITVSADNNIRMAGLWTASESITLAAGQGVGGFGGITTLDVNSNGTGADLTLNVTGSGGTLSMKAGEFGGNLQLATDANSTRAMIDVNGTVTLEANDGRILHQDGELKADKLVTTAGSDTQIRSRIAQADMRTLGAGSITLDNKGTLNLERISAADGAISVVNIGNLVATQVQTLGSSSRNSITLEGLRTNGEITLQVRNVLAGGRGDVVLNAQGVMTQIEGGVIRGDHLSITAVGDLEIDTDVNGLTLDIRRQGNVVVNQGDRHLRVTNSEISDGTFTLNAEGRVSLDSLRLGSNRAGNDIQVNAEGDIVVGSVVAGVYLLPIGGTDTVTISAAHASDQSHARTIDLSDVEVVEGGQYRLTIGNGAGSVNGSAVIRYTAQAGDGIAEIAAALAQRLSDYSGFDMTASAEGGVITISSGAGARAISAFDQVSSAGDIRLTSAGSILRSVGGGDRVNLVADRLNLNAGTGILNLNIAANQLRANTTDGSILISERDGGFERTTGLLLVEAKTRQDGDATNLVSIRAQNNLLVGDPGNGAHAAIDADLRANTIRLASEHGDVQVVRQADGSDSLNYDRGIAFEAAGVVDVYRFFQGPELTEYRAGHSLLFGENGTRSGALPGDIKSHTIIFDTGALLSIDGTLTARDLIELRSDRDVIVAGDIVAEGAESIGRLIIEARGTQDVTSAVATNSSGTFISAPGSEAGDVRTIDLSTVTISPGLAYALLLENGARADVVHMANADDTVATVATSLATQINAVDGFEASASDGVITVQNAGLHDITYFNTSVRSTGFVNVNVATLPIERMDIRAERDIFLRVGPEGEANGSTPESDLLLSGFIGGLQGFSAADNVTLDVAKGALRLTGGIVAA